uniref:Hypothetical chloroplast RF1 n=1 Tax=Pleodorina starrii TaxID=330485 RepID=M9P8D8_9CHLO|nr:hypothetical chloroplast RF1 [Pleodorina starrii]AFY64418.1 hypothetical chloroplast RF1 [Pleodorina starrii]
MISLTFMSLVTSVKDYVEITHKLIEIEPLKNYTEYGAIFSYLIFSLGDFFKAFFSLSLFKNIWSIPIIIPDIASAMISEVSVLDGYFHNAFTFLETNVNTSPNTSLVIFEKFIIGLINSLFLILPTSTSHLITLRRFVMQGLEAGYMAGLGTLAGNFLWLSSIILGLRFIVIPWLSLDIFRYLLGFILLVKYIWDSSKERRMALEDLSKWKIFFLNFLLTLTEQSCIYPFISNLSIGPDASILEGFTADNYTVFLAVHGAYLFGILVGSFSLLQFTCWFWENPAFSIYLWITTKSSLKISTSSYYKILNFTFLYATMLCAIASIPYYGLDYTITNPIGLVPQDRIIDQKKSQADPEKLITETAFLGMNSTDKNSRIRDGVHARRERWKQRLIKYQAFDASMYDQGVYDFLTVEDLNYGFDRFWLRRKMRNHQIRFRLFPGPWMRSLKKQLNNPTNQSLENSKKVANGPRVEFFRILFEQFYHPNFHQRILLDNNTTKSYKTDIETKNIETNKETIKQTLQVNNNIKPNIIFGTPLFTVSKELDTGLNIKSGLIYSNSALRKYVRNVNTRINLKLLTTNQSNLGKNNRLNQYNTKLIYSKRWKSFFSKIQPLTKTKNRKSYQLFRNLAKQLLLTSEAKSLKLTTLSQSLSINSQQKKGQNELKLLKLCTQYKNNNSFDKLISLRPLKIYLQKEQAFKRKLRYYGTISMRKLTVGNQAPYFKILMKRGFYYYKPSLRWKKTLYVARLSRGFRKQSRKQRILVMSDLKSFEGNNQSITNIETNIENSQQTQGLKQNEKSNVVTKPTHFYTVLGKRTSRYRHQIYKDVLQHWYYTPFNRLLLKFDVDAFINRQPKTHFLTKNEERILHIRRFLLSEHYDTLRWYTYMQHYQTMKTNIGGTKSFANRIYNQQFQGTFKKIRHLFAITPKQGDLYSLKFDQALYNDNKLKDNVYFHEELLTDNSLNNQSKAKFDGVKSAITNNSFHITSENFSSEYKNKISQREENTNFSMVEENPLVVKTDKLMSQNIGINKTAENLDLINQSNFLIGNAFLSIKNKNNGILNNPQVTGIEDSILNKTKAGKKNVLKTDFNFIYNELFVNLIKESKKRVHDQTFLKNYITYRIEKREQLNQEQTKELNKRLEKLKIWINREQQIKTIVQNKEIDSPQKNVLTVSSFQKAVNDSINYNVTKQKAVFKVKSTYNELNNAYTIRAEDKVLNKLNILKQLTFENKKHLKVATGIQSNITLTTSFTKRSLEKTKRLLTNTMNSFKPFLLGQTILKAQTDKNLQWWRKKQIVITKRKNSRKRDRFKKQIAMANNEQAKRIEENNKKVEKEKKELYSVLYGNYNISDYLLPISENQTKWFTDSRVLRKKQDKSAVLLDIDTTKNKNQFQQSQKNSEKQTLWQAFLRKKLRKKASSKGRRYRLLSLSRYLTATRKPRLVGIEGLTKLDNITNLKGSFLTKEEKQDALNLIIENKQNGSDFLKKSQIKKRSRHSWKKQARQQFSRNHYKYRKRHIHGNGKLRVMNKKLKKNKATNELRQWWWTSFLPRYLNNLQINNTYQQAFLGNVNDISFKPLSNSDITFINSDTKILNNNAHNLLDNLNSSLDNVIYPNVNVNLGGTVNTTNLPFYAGWDECLRKFVVTNRLVSRRDAGLAIRETQKPNSQETRFTNAPLQGLNEGSFLYGQTDMPFNSYNIDQFITTNQSFYAPFGWRHFEFRHSILKTWVNSLGSVKNNKPSHKKKGQTLIVSMKNLRPLNTYLQAQKHEKIATKKAVARRIKKRYKLLKQMPNQLMYSPTGPLLIQVLPSHYISVFDQQYRFPRNRYLKRNTLKTIKKTTLLAMIDSANQTPIKEFTLRKRVKPRRKYHRKRFIKKDGLIIPRRTKFTNLNLTENQIAIEDYLRWRPSSKSKQKGGLRSRLKIKSNKRVKTNPLRLRQLRRREFQQILKPIQRYIPYNGGFAWPGDYLRLEIVEMPKLKNANVKKTSLKQKINVQPVGIMPRKYLIEKHNIKVLKKKFEKAYSSHQLSKAVKQYKNLFVT